MDTMIIGIAGGTGSGKTTLTRRLKERFGGHVSVLYHDNYYKQHDDMPFEERCKLNYDHPDAFDTDRMIRDIRALRWGRPSTVPLTTIPPTTAPPRRWRSGPPRSSLLRASSSSRTKSCGT